MNQEPVVRPPASSQEEPAYASADPATDHRRRYAGTEWCRPSSNRPTRTVSGEWMIPVILDLPYAMLASLEATAQSEEIGAIIRAALVAAGHGDAGHIADICSDRYATIDELRAAEGKPPLTLKWRFA